MTRILFVDDEPHILEGLRDALRPQRREWRMTFAASGAEAVALLDREPFDVVVSDIGLPDGTGLELMRELLTARPIKGIALTGYGLASDVEESRRAGFAAHLTKPIKFADVAETIRRLT